MVEQGRSSLEAGAAPPPDGGHSDNRKHAIQLGIGLAAFVTLGFVLYLAAGGTTNTRDYKAPTDSMVPTLAPGQPVEADVRAYDSADPEIGDIVVFNPPAGALYGNDVGPAFTAPQCESPKTPVTTGRLCAESSIKRIGLPFIDRVAAGPGDTIAIEDGHAVVNGAVANEDFIKPCKPGTDACNLPTAITVPDGQVYVLGDNRGVAVDSRFWGPVPVNWVVGKVKTG